MFARLAATIRQSVRNWYQRDRIRSEIGTDTRAHRAGWGRERKRDPPGPRRQGVIRADDPDHPTGIARPPCRLQALFVRLLCVHSVTKHSRIFFHIIKYGMQMGRARPLSRLLIGRRQEGAAACFMPCMTIYNIIRKKTKK